MDLKNKLDEGSKFYQTLEEIFVGVLVAHAPRKTKVLLGNHKPQVNKTLRKVILKRST